MPLVRGHPTAHTFSARYYMLQHNIANVLERHTTHRIFGRLASASSQRAKPPQCNKVTTVARGKDKILVRLVPGRIKRP